MPYLLGYVEIPPSTGHKEVTVEISQAILTEEQLALGLILRLSNLFVTGYEKLLGQWAF